MEFIIIVLVLLAIWMMIRAGKRRRDRADMPVQEYRPAPVRRTATKAGSDPVFDPSPVLRDGMSEDWLIRYVDRDDVETTRTVTVRSLHGDRYPKYIHGFCHLRQDDRHFNLYNVLSCQDPRGRDVPVRRNLLDWLDTRDLKPDGVEHELAEPVPVVIRNDKTGEVWDMQITTFLNRYGNPLIRGRATRRKTQHHRKWTGQKTFGHDHEDVICDPDTSDTWRDARLHPDIARQIQD